MLQFEFRPAQHISTVAVEQVANGKVDALVLDEPWLRYQTNQRCEFRMVGRIFQYVDNAVGFNVNIEAGFVREYNLALLSLLEVGFYETLEKAYIKESACLTLEVSQSINLHQVIGLWIIFCALLGIAILLMLLPRIFPKMDFDVGRFKRSMSMFGRSISRIVPFSGNKPVSMESGDVAIAAATKKQEFANVEEAKQSTLIKTGHPDVPDNQGDAERSGTSSSPNPGGQNFQNDDDELVRIVQSW